jgi:2-polyprenyl-3-methyl-5-hydroxy-6-metoxy-1,4-benzoquinol methylase
MQSSEYNDYGFPNADQGHMFGRIAKAIFGFAAPLKVGARVLDIGCGNGNLCAAFQRQGCQAVGIDLSESGIALARQHFPDCRFELLGVGEMTLDRLGESPFDIVVSTEVIEHLYAPRVLPRAAFAALKPGGLFVVTTPYHGFAKNLALSLSNHWNVHADPLWDGGHIKLFSRQTLFRILEDAGFSDLRFRGVGRLPYLWMSMAVAGRKP